MSPRGAGTCGKQAASGGSGEDKLGTRAAWETGVSRDVVATNVATAGYSNFLLGEITKAVIVRAVWLGFCYSLL